MDKSDIQIAKNLLGREGAVFVIVKNGKVLFTSSKKGIQPFFDALEQYPREIFAGCSIADRVVGKAALMLAAYIKAKEVYTPLASQHAIDASFNLNLNLMFDKSTAFIINRTQDGMCPMEEAVLNVNDREKAFTVLSEKLNSLRST